MSDTSRHGPGEPNAQHSASWMPTPLESITDKVARARELLDEVRRLREPWRQSMQGPTLESYTDDGVNYRWTLPHLQPLPLRIGTVIGEMLHDLRSALDQSVVALVEANGGTVTRQTLFPFCETETEWRRALQPRGRIFGIEESAAQVIRSTQKFTVGSEQRKLWLLKDASNTEKHNHALPLHIVALEVTPHLDEHWTDVKTFPPVRAISPTTPIVQARSLRERPDRQIHVDLRIAPTYGGLPFGVFTRMVEEAEEYISNFVNPRDREPEWAWAHLYPNPD